MNKKRVILVVFIFICFIFIASLLSWKYLSKTQEGNIYNKINEDKAIEVDGNISLSKEQKEHHIVSGAKVLERYEEVKNDEYAFLVATNAFLEQNKEDLQDCDEILYLKYVLSKNDQGIVENVHTKNGMLVPFVFINYNTVLDDTCLYQVSSQSYLESNYGFIKNNESTIFGEDILHTFPLIQSKKEDIFTIYEESSFLENLIYNNEGKLLGYSYVEQ